jgi:hypothetical protein
MTPFFPITTASCPGRRPDAGWPMTQKSPIETPGPISTFGNTREVEGSITPLIRLSWRR